MIFPSKHGNSTVSSMPGAAAPPSMRPLIDVFAGKAGWIAVAVLCAAYVACIAPLTSFPMQDYANHLARAQIMADIVFHHGSDFGRFFGLHLAPVPYVLPDLILMSAVEVFGLHVGAGLYTGLVLLSLPCALLFYAHVINLPRRAQPFVLLVGLYLSTGWSFLMGFLAFRLALALIVVSLAIAEMLRRSWSIPVFFGYIAVLVLGFLTHLSAVVFMGAAIGVSALVRLWFKTTTLRREIYLLAPVAVLFAWYFGVTARLHEVVGSRDYNLAAPSWRSLVGTKIRNLPHEFIALDFPLATPILLLFAACLLLPVRRELNRSGLNKPEAVEQLVLAAVFLGIYVVLPRESTQGDYVDVRALPMVTLGLLFASLRLPSMASAGRTFGNLGVLGLAALLAVTNLVYVMQPLSRNNLWIHRYRAVVASIPKDSYVFPIVTPTRLQQGLMYADAHIVLDRRAIIPYLFSSDNEAPMTYFHYRQLPYAPDPQWYRWLLKGDTRRGAVNWNQVSCDYDFLLVTVPFDTRFIRVPTVTVASNEVAVLMAVDKRPCELGSR